MERGAQWEGIDREGAPAVFLVAQQSDEPAAQFVRRVRQRLNELGSSGVSATSAMFATSCARGELDPFSRFVLADLLLRRLADADSELVLHGAEDATVAERATLMDLASALFTARGSAAHITVRFGSTSRNEEEPMLESGTRHRIPTAPPARSADDDVAFNTRT
jgi:hypothetical protein